MDYLLKQVKEGNITREEADQIEKEQQILFKNSSIDEYNEFITNKNRQDITDINKESVYNTALMKKLTSELVELSVTDSAKGHIEENYEYKKLTNKEKKARRKELEKLSKDNRELTIESVNMATDYREFYENKRDAIIEFSDKNEFEFSGEQETIALLLCQGSKEKSSKEEDYQRLHDYFRGGLAAKNAVLDNHVQMLLDIKVDSRMLNESYIISHFVETGNICEQFKYLDVLMSQNREYFDGLSEDKKAVLQVMKETVRSLDSFRAEVCNSYGVFSERGVYIPNFDERKKQEHKTEIKHARERGIAALNAMKLNKARILAAQSKGLRQLDAATYVARHDFDNPYIDTAGCNAKIKLDQLKKDRQASITDEIKAKAEEAGIDVRIFIAYSYGFEKDEQGYVKTATDGWQKSRDVNFINNYLTAEGVNRAFLIDNIVNEAREIRERFDNINESDILANPQTYAVIAERMAILDNIVKGQENAEFIDAMDAYKREELFKGILPSAQYIYAYINATFKKHGYNLETGNYLTKEESENNQDASSLEIKIALSKHSLNKKESHERELNENTLNKAGAFSSRLDALKGQYYNLINMEADPVILENQELVNMVSDSFIAKMDNAFWPGKFLINDNCSEKLVLAELFKKTISTDFIDSLFNYDKVDIILGKISGMLMDNAAFKKLIDASILRDEKNSKYSGQFMTFLYERAIGSMMFAKIAKEAKEEFIRLRMDKNNLNVSDENLRKTAEKNTNYDEKIKVWLEVGKDIKGYGEEPRSTQAVVYRKFLEEYSESKKLTD